MSHKPTRLSVIINQGDLRPSAFENAPKLVSKLLPLCGLVALCAAEAQKEGKDTTHQAVIDSQPISAIARLTQSDKANTLSVTLQKDVSKPQPHSTSLSPTSDILENTPEPGDKLNFEIIERALKAVPLLRNNKPSHSIADRQTAKHCSANILGAAAHALQKAVCPEAKIDKNTFRNLVTQRAQEVKQDTENYTVKWV